MVPKGQHSELHQATIMAEAPAIILATPLEPATRPAGRMSAARSAVREFLSTELGAREVRITKMAPSSHELEGWESEAEILVPNLEVKMLNLPLTQEVFEIEHYAVELAADLSIRSYGPLSASED